MSFDVRLLSPRGPGGVAVVEVRGARAEAALAGLMVDRPLPAPGSMTLARLVLPGSGEVLDEALVVRPPAGAALEVHLHGSPAIVDEVLALLAPAPRRASLEERAQAAAAAAPAEAGARLLLAQGDGRLREALGEVLLRPGSDRHRDLLRETDRHRRLFEPARVVLLGPVNAGKSTLFNALVGEDAALVSDIPGTTRDARGRHAVIGGWPVILVDTAGARELGADAGGHAAVEREGQELALGAARSADLVLLLDREAASEEEGAAGIAAPPGVPMVQLVSRSARAAAGADSGAGDHEHIAALERPEHARSVVARALRGALSLPELDVRRWPAAAPAVAFGSNLTARLGELLARPGETMVLDALRAEL